MSDIVRANWRLQSFDLELRSEDWNKLDDASTFTNKSGSTSYPTLNSSENVGGNPVL